MVNLQGPGESVLGLLSFWALVMNLKVIGGLLAVYLLGGTLWYFLGSSGRESDIVLLNVSYDPTRELYKEINALFTEQFEKEQGIRVVIQQSHGGSGSQARAVIDGLQADVTTLALWSDTNQLLKKGLLKNGWEDRLPNRSLPYYSTIVFVVRKGNPKQIRDWPHLIKPGVQIITPNPKTSGNGQLSFLAAWGAILERGGTDADAEEFVTQMYRQTPVLDTAARGATTTFAQKKIGDVHLTWENEAHLEVQEAGDELEIVYPPVSIKAEPHVTVVDANVDRKGTRPFAEAYLKFLYTPQAQEVIARHFFRPSDESVLARHAKTLRPLDRQFSIERIDKGGWGAARARFFDQGALFDRIYEGKK